MLFGRIQRLPRIWLGMTAAKRLEHAPFVHMKHLKYWVLPPEPIIAPALRHAEWGPFFRQTP